MAFQACCGLCVLMLLSRLISWYSADCQGHQPPQGFCPYPTSHYLCPHGDPFSNASLTCLTPLSLQVSASRSLPGPHSLQPQHQSPSLLETPSQTAVVYIIDLSSCFQDEALSQHEVSHGIEGSCRSASSKTQK